MSNDGTGVWNMAMFGTRILSGAGLFCIGPRASWSDFSHGNCLRLNTQRDCQIVYADIEVQTHKTMRAAANRSKFLDLVVSGIGMAVHDWIKHRLEGLRYIGLGPLNGDIGLSLMPTPGNDGQALQRSLESDEAIRIADVYDRETQARRIRSIDRLLVKIKTGMMIPLKCAKLWVGQKKGCAVTRLTTGGRAHHQLFLGE